MTVQEAIQLAMQKQQAGQLAEAEAIYRQVLAAQPDSAEALNLLGTLAAQQGRLAEAAELISRAAKLARENVEIYVNLGVVLLIGKRADLAESAFRRALALRPGDAAIHHNLGTALQSLGRLPEAMAELNAAVRSSPNNAGYLSALGSALSDMGRWNDAIEFACRSLAINPESPETHLNLGVLLLRSGQFAQGWNEYEWRWRVKNIEIGPALSDKPIWNGGDLSGKSILLRSEQGFGDAIQMTRYAPMVKARGGTTVLYCQNHLVRLLGGAPGIDRVVSWEEAPPPCDEHCPLLSLPRIFKTELTNIPHDVPYLSPDAELSRRWRERIGGEKRRCVGLVWAGGGGHIKDRQRSLTLKQFEFLRDAGNIRLFSLQKGKPGEQAGASPMELTDWTNDLDDFADTAALIDNLDMVVTIDSAVAHLAGAMGKPVWVLLPWVPDWRWMLEQSDSPWYPTMRLFRQKTMDDWQAPLDELAGAIKRL